MSDIPNDILQEIRKLTKLEISERALRSIVIEYISRTYHVNVKDVRFLVSRDYEGYGPTEHEVVKFNGCTVTLEGD